MMLVLALALLQDPSAGVGIDQHLGKRVPLDLPFRDEEGRAVRLADYFEDRPVVLAPVYFRCPMLCKQVLRGLIRGLKPLDLEPGGAFEVVAFSFDSRETPAQAARAKAAFLGASDRAGWHFLTGSERSVERLTEAIGFRWRMDPATNRPAHAAGLMVLTPDGRLARYFHGIEVASRDLRLAVVEASDGTVGTLADELTLLCFQYDPEEGRYGFAVLRAIRIGGVLTMVVLIGFVGSALLRERRRRRRQGGREHG